MDQDERLEGAGRTRAVHVREGCDVYVGRAFRAWAKPSPLNPVPGRFGNPFKPGGVGTPGAMLRRYFEPWLVHLPAPEREALLSEARRRMGPDEDAFDSFRWYLERRTREDPAFLADVRALKGKRLGCWCKPKRCHGDEIVCLDRFG